MITEHTKTLTQTEYFRFYTLCIESLKKRLPREYAPPSSKSYYQISTGIGGVHFEWAFHGRPRSSFGMEFHFEKGNKEQNQAMVGKCIQDIDRLERELGSKVIVMKDWGKAWARLYIEKQEGRMTDDLREWAVDKMDKMIRFLQPELDKMKLS